MSRSYRVRATPALRGAVAVTKVAVSLPPELLAAVDRVAKSRGRTRSAIFQDALRVWLGEHEAAILVREYEAGYRRIPEDAREIKAAEAAAIRVLAEEEW